MADPRWQRLTDILQNKVNAWELLPQLAARGEALDPTAMKQISDNIDAVKHIVDYDIPEQTIPIHASVREAIEIFYIVNKAGITLTHAELALAQISGYWPEAREKFKSKLTELRAKGFDFSLDMCVYLLQACLHASGTELHKLHAPDDENVVKQAWEKLSTETIDYALNLLRGHAYLDHSSELSTPFVIVPVVAWLYHSKEKPNQIP